jgi:hypothetical protein
MQREKKEFEITSKSIREEDERNQRLMESIMKRILEQNKNKK